MTLKPYKRFTVLDVTQGFHSGHQAIDCVPQKGAYGKPLVAPEKVVIEQVVTPSRVDESLKDLEYGYGVWMRGQETGDRYLYWHCLPVFPVWGGDIIEKGQIVAFIGNAGNVYRGGVYVPLYERATSHKGTHLHLIHQKNGVPVDPLPLEEEPTYTTLDFMLAMMKTLAKITK